MPHKRVLTLDKYGKWVPAVDPIHFDKPINHSKELVNLTLKSLPEKVKYTGFVSSEGFTFNKDNVHFDSKSLRESGRRYAEVYLKITE